MDAQRGGADEQLEGLGPKVAWRKDRLTFLLERDRQIDRTCGALAAAVVSTAIFLSPWSADKVARWGLPARWALIVCIVVFTGFAIVGVVEILRNRPPLVIDDHGIRTPSRLLPWEDVEKVELTKETVLGVPVRFLKIRSRHGEPIKVERSRLGCSRTDARALINRWALEHVAPHRISNFGRETEFEATGSAMLDELFRSLEHTEQPPGTDPPEP